MPFSEDDAVEIAMSSKEAEAFDKKYPDCVVNVEKMKAKEIEAWIKKHPKAEVQKGAAPPKALWLVELEALEKEKLVVVVSPDTKKVVDAHIEKLEAEPAEEEEAEAEAEEEGGDE